MLGTLKYSVACIGCTVSQKKKNSPLHSIQMEIPVCLGRCESAIELCC